MKTYYKEAVDAYMASDEGSASCDPATLRAPSEMRTYLENRLRRAYAAGWNACGEHHSVESEPAE